MDDVIMPKLGLTMESGTIEKWHKKEGDIIKKGDVLFEVMTDKVSLEVEAYHSGILKKILRKEGEDVPVTEVVAYIGEKDDQIPEVNTPIKDKKVETIGKNKEEPIAGIPMKITVKSSTTLKGMRKTIAERMSLSKSTIPHSVQNIVADITNLLKLQVKFKEKILSIYNIRVTYTDFLLKICGIALRENIEINASLQNNNYIIYDDINIGLAVYVKEGLIIPTFFKCDKLSILDIARKRIELIEKIKRGILQVDEMANGTFTIINLGMFGIRSSGAVINPPQAAILAIGEIYEAPAVVDNRIEKRSFIKISVSFDHRIIDGAELAKFMQKITELIENPEMVILS